MARTGCASGAAISACGTARNQFRARQVLPAYGLQSLPPIHFQELTKVLLRTIPGGHFNMAENRTFLLCVDTPALNPRPPGWLVGRTVEVVRQKEESCAVQTSPTSIGEGVRSPSRGRARNNRARGLPFAVPGGFFAKTYFFSSMMRASNGLLAKFSGRCSQGSSDERNSPAFFWNFSVLPSG